ncbi:uncharacterized protein LOC110696864 [Chenopodium quinoa]|uniref:uncharacterized protein LOC110696864 n=1 Tax=Chenopodium quinoa TaxID=63459 RepID=UPI000B78DB31|nr:uncharacterized protein LOC110696864 [Chenopodium quinoa]
MILCSGRHMFYGKPAIVKAWSSKFDFQAEVLRTVPLWVKFPNLPLNYWGVDTLSRIGSLLGVSNCADECTTRLMRVSFARVLIEVDITKELPSSVLLESPNGEIIELKAIFEWKPPFCKKCNKAGHDCAAVKSGPPDSEQVQATPAAALGNVNHDDGWRVVGRKNKSIHNVRNSQPIAQSSAFLALNVEDGGFFHQHWRGGLNDPGRVVNVKRLLRNHSIEVIGLLETKVKQGKFKTLQKKFRLSWSWVDNYSYSQKGRIWVRWNSDVINLDVLTVHEQFIHCAVSHRDSTAPILCTFVYGLHSIHDRKALWTGIQTLGLQQDPWICVGDFNSVLCSADRINGNPVSDYEVRDFQGFVDIMEFCEVKSKGPFYSWSDKAHEGPKNCTRIDRGLVNQSWLDIYGHVEAFFLNPALSDHSPVLIELCSAPSSQGRPFRFLNCIAKHDQF